MRAIRSSGRAACRVIERMIGELEALDGKK